MATLIESNGTVSLYRNTDGTFSASQGGVSTLIKDYGNPPTPTTISNIVAADYLNGVRIVVFGGGHTWYVDSNWQKAPVGPGGADTINLTPEQLNAVLSGGSPVVPVPPIAPIAPVLPTYAISAVTMSTSEGGTAVFNVVTTLLPEGTLLNYTLSGIINAADIVGGNFNGSVRIDANGRGVINIGIANDALIEGPEGFSIRLDINSAAVGHAINDVPPTGPVTRTLMESNGTVSLYRNSDGTFSAVEGGNSTLIKDSGNTTPTTIPNIVAADYLNGVRIVVFGGGHTWYVDGNWQKAPVGPNGADVINLTLEQYRAILDGTTPVIPVAPTTPTYSIATLNPSIAEGGTATFSVTTTNVVDGTLLNYSISGDVNAADIMGPLQGTVRINASGNGVISVVTASDVILEGPEILRVRLDINGATRDTVINDGAASPPTNRTLMESNGTVSLYRNSDGTFSAVEGGVSTFIKDYGNPPTPTTIADIVAADYLNGSRIVVFSSGHTWYVDSNWQKARVGPSGADTTQLTPAQVSALISGGSPVVPTQTLVESNGTVSLFRNSDGTFSAQEGSNSTLIKDYGNPPNTDPHYRHCCRGIL